MYFKKKYLLSFFFFFIILSFNSLNSSPLSLNIPKATSVKSIKIDFNSSSSQINQIIEFTKTENIYSVGINAEVEFVGSDSYARFLLIDSNYDEYLIYESSPMFVSSDKEEIVNGCDETSSLHNISIIGIRVVSEFCSVKIDDLVYINQSKLAQSSSLADSMDEKISEKVDRINTVLRSKNSLWVAGDTPIARLSYEEKKVLFGGKVPNTYGFEYYKGGIFTIPSDDLKAAQSAINPKASLYVDAFTWENRHGKKWVTPVKDQAECGGCWAFAVTAATELMVNLYFNQKLDLDLSEQDLISCSGAGDCIEGGLPGEAIDYIIRAGIVDESCFNYRATNSSCGYKCANPRERIKLSQKRLFNSSGGSENDLKQMIIGGPVSSGVYNWEHAVAMVGYKTLKSGDRILLDPRVEDNWVTLNSSSPYVGQTAWRIKNSWGSSWGDNGYAYIVTSLSNIEWTWGIEGSVTSLNYSDSDIRCVDEDGDGYYTWGIGSKPATCPTCPDEPDGDDSDPKFGPMDQYGNLTQVANYITLTSPSDNMLYQNPDMIQMAADAYVSSGSVVRVDFYVDNSLVDSDNTSPYNGTWNSPVIGIHEIHAKAVFDSQSSVESQKTDIIVSGTLGEGSISRFVYRNIAGGSVTNLTSSSKFPSSPDLEDEISVFQIPLNYSTNYGTRIAGFIHPPVTGNYKFYISGNENAQLYLSSDEDESNKTKIAEIYNGSSYEEWDKESSQESIQIYLETDKKYFIETLQKDDFGTDHLSVGWLIPGGSEIQVIQGTFLSTYEEPVKEYHVVFSANSNGSVTGSLSQVIQSGGSTLKVTAVPDTGYYFTGWSGDYSGTVTDLILDNITADKSIYANFAINEYTLTFAAGSNGSIDGLSLQTINHGGSSSLVTALPDSGYRFSGWSGDYTGTETGLVLQNIRSDMTINASFVEAGITTSPTDGDSGGTDNDGGNQGVSEDGDDSGGSGSSGGGCFIGSMFQ